MFGCTGFAADSIEHYAYCAVVRQVALRHLRLSLRTPPDGLADFVLASQMPGQPQPATVLVRMALLVYASYTAFNNAKCLEGAGPTAAAASARPLAFLSFPLYQGCALVIKADISFLSN